MTPLGIASIDRARSIIYVGRDPDEGMTYSGQVHADRRRRGHIQSIQPRQGSILFLRRGSDCFKRMEPPPLLVIPPRSLSSTSLLDLPSSASAIQQRRALENCLIWRIALWSEADSEFGEIRDDLPHSD
jgi:hypothetical protein